MGESPGACRCQACGGPLPPYGGRGRPRSYCDPRCRRRAERRLQAARLAAQPLGGYEALLRALGQTHLPTTEELGAVELDARAPVLDVDRADAAMRRGR
jgi:hypothetical protein